MSEPGPIAYASFNSQAAVDRGHLTALAICHYVAGGLMMLFGSIFIIHIIMGFAILRGQLPMNSSPGQPPGPPPDFIGYMFIVMGSVAVLLGWTLGILNILSGRCIGKRRRRTFSLVMAGINCAVFPIGTALGVFTFIVLLRQSVIQTYLYPQPPT